LNVGTAFDDAKRAGLRVKGGSEPPEQ